MLREEVKITAIKTITELAIKWLWRLVIVVLVVFIAYIPPIKKELVQYPAYGEISFALLVVLIPVAVLMLIWIVRMYWRYGRFREDFGVF